MRSGDASRAQRLPRSLNTGSRPHPSPGATTLEALMSGKLRRLSALCTLLLTAASCAVADGWQHIGKVERVAKLADGVELTAGKAKVRVTAFREGVFRVRVAPDGNFPKDFSWAVVEEAAA